MQLLFLLMLQRLADGNQFGWGLRLGLVPQKLHARGPMGLEEFTSSKFIVLGDGQCQVIIALLKRGRNAP